MLLRVNFMPAMKISQMFGQVYDRMILHVGIAHSKVSSAAADETWGNQRWCKYKLSKT
jgi:hydrogenase maturation factor